jgi:hypothetical protein
MASLQLGNPESEYIERYKSGEDGQIVRVVRYDASRTLRYGFRRTYEFDEVGNWLERRVEALDTAAGELVWAACLVVYLKIDYEGQ